jgi:hypothetical protein
MKNKGVHRRIKLIAGQMRFPEHIADTCGKEEHAGGKQPAGECHFGVLSHNYLFCLPGQKGLFHALR